MINGISLHVATMDIYKQVGYRPTNHCKGILTKRTPHHSRSKMIKLKIRKTTNLFSIVKSYHIFGVTVWIAAISYAFICKFWQH